MQTVWGELSAEGLRGRLRWLIRLRWVAIAGVAGALFVASVVLKLSLPLAELSVGTGILVVLNLGYLIYQQRSPWFQDRSVQNNRGHRFAHVQITADLTLLACFIHFTGGAENPLVFFFILHMVIASILLTRRSAYLQAGIAATLLAAVFLGEMSGLLAHYHVDGFIPTSSCLIQPIYVAGVYTVLVLTIFATVFLATTIMRGLRKGEAELAQANEALEGQDRVKSQYVLRVSHDIKSSLSTIQACVQVVLSDLAGPLSSKGRDILERAERRSRSLLAFVRDLLDLSKMRARREVELEVVAVGRSVEGALDQIRPIAIQKGVGLRCTLGSEEYVRSTPGGLEEVMLNLIGDGVKYTMPGGEVVVTMSEPAGPSIELIVSDTGIGIDKEELPFVFDDFYRAQNAITVEQEGSGLGLSIVKQIVDSIGGRVWVESERGNGTRFHLVLDRAPSPEGVDE